MLLCRDEVVAVGGLFVAACSPDCPGCPGQRETSQPGRLEPPGEAEEGGTR